MTPEEADLEFMQGPDYEVTCARCGRIGLASVFLIEEGDEWECPPCWERCEREEREDAFAERYNAALDRHYGYAPKPKKPDDKTPLD